jgi:hypothetical protein
MNHVVMIAYGFPPEGNAGVYRPLRFVRQLPKMGWAASVISAIPSQYERYDPQLLSMVPSETEVLRVKGYDQWQAFQSWRARRTQNPKDGVPAHTREAKHSHVRSWIRETVHNAEACWYHPDMTQPWIPIAVEETVKLCERIGAKVMWATAPPVSSFCVAERASRRTGVPYVLDFRDPMTIVPTDFESIRPAWAVRLDRRRMFRLLQGAQAVIFRHAMDAECFWRAYPKAMEAGSIHLIPNGYEGEVEDLAVEKREKCRLVYIGTLWPYRYDTLLQALRSLKQTDPGQAKQLSILFVGDNAEVVCNEAHDLGISEMIEVKGFTKQAQLVGLLRQADALLVLGQIPTIRGYELRSPSKLFSYLKAGRPIVGILPSDETKNILKRIGILTIADVDSVPDIVRVLRQILDRWDAGALSSLVPDPKACKAYSAEVQTAALEHALNGIPPQEPFVPGTVQVPLSLQNYIGKDGWQT